MTNRRIRTGLRTHLILCFVAIMTGSVDWPAQATVITVAEQGNLRNTAFSVNPFFSLPPPPEAFGTEPTVTIKSDIDGNSDVDWYSFTVQAGRSIWIDVDNNLVDSGLTVTDTMLSLFNSAGTLLAFNDDIVGLDPGSSSNRDSFLGVYTPPASDTYFVAVTGFDLIPSVISFPSEGCTGVAPLTRPDGQFGGDALAGCTAGDDSFVLEAPVTAGAYALHITSVTEPGTLALLGAGLFGLGLMRRRRRG